MIANITILIIQTPKKLHSTVFTLSLIYNNFNRTKAFNRASADMIRFEIFQFIPNHAQFSKVINHIKIALFKEATSNCKSKMRDKSPWEYLVFKSFQISRATSIQVILCLMGRETKWINQETTMLLQRNQAEKVGLFFGGQGWVPRMNSTLFLALIAVMIERLHEW